MKSSREIIVHIKNNPSLTHLKKIESYKKLLSLLPKRLAGGVRFMYNKNETLFFVLEHPGLKMEFNYKMGLIKELLKELISKDPSCKNIDAKEIKCFVTNKPPLKTPPCTPTGPFYTETSMGEFKNCATSKELHAQFESIRERILCSLRH
jgi:hypothetical protein